MGTIKDLFLTAKAWQIFILLFAAPYILSFMFILGSMFVFPQSIYLFAFLSALNGICIVGWYWSLGSFLASLLNPNLRLHAVLLNFAAVYPVIYIPAFLWGVIFTSAIESPAVVFPLHSLGMACILYLIYYAAKSLALVRIGRAVTFSDYAAQFFGLWFFPIGVWFCQPTVNQLYRTSRGELLVKSE